MGILLASLPFGGAVPKFDRSSLGGSRLPTSPKKNPQTSANLNGHVIHNKILLSLPDKERSTVFEKLEFVSLPTHMLLNEAEGIIEHGFFIMKDCLRC
jgi:hypothetical protein